MSGVVPLTKDVVALGSRYMVVPMWWGMVDTGTTLAVQSVGGGMYCSSSSCKTV